MAIKTKEAVALLSAAQLRDERMANHIRSFSRDATNVAKVIQKGIMALISSISHFTAEPPRVADGIVALGVELMECVDMLMPGTEKGTAEYKRFKGAWSDTFQ